MIAPGPRISEDDFPQQGGASGQPDVDPLHQLIGQLMQVRRYAADYFVAEADLFRAIIRRWLIHAIVGAVVAIIGLTGLVTAVVFALAGVAGVISDLSGIPWLGQLLTGFGIIAALGIADWFVLAGRSDASRRRAVSKYDHKHHTEETARRHDDERTTN